MSRKDIVCFVLKGAEKQPARGRRAEKNITLALHKFFLVQNTTDITTFLNPLHHRN
jgi:hypothetical protein